MSSIIIIPDYVLQTISFEALISDRKKNLIEDYEINYTYSISFLNQNKKFKRTSIHDFLGFAQSLETILWDINAFVPLLAYLPIHIENNIIPSYAAGENYHEFSATTPPDNLVIVVKEN